MYVDGCVFAVPNANREAFSRFSEMACALFREHGALEAYDCWGDQVPDGKLTSFPMAVKLEPGETVVFSWMKWPDKATRDAGMEAACADPRLNNEEFKSLFDGKRMIFGSFVPLATD